MPFLHIAFKLSLSCSKQGKNVTNEHLFVCEKSVQQSVGPERPRWHAEQQSVHHAGVKNKTKNNNKKTTCLYPACCRSQYIESRGAMGWATWGPFRDETSLLGLTLRRGQLEGSARAGCFASSGPGRHLWAPCGDWTLIGCDTLCLYLPAEQHSSSRPCARCHRPSLDWVAQRFD